MLEVRASLDRLLEYMSCDCGGSGCGEKGSGAGNREFLMGPGGWGEAGMRGDGVHRAAVSWEEVERLPVIFSYPYPEGVRFQPLAGRLMYRWPEAMLYNELVYAWGSSPLLSPWIGDDLEITVRPNWGTVVVASVIAEAVARRRGFVPRDEMAGVSEGFRSGAVPALVEQRGDDPPWIIRNEEYPVRLEELAGLVLSRDELAGSGWMPRILTSFAAFRALLDPWPELGRVIRMTLPDLQGPLDTAEQLMGAELFMEMMDRPGLAQDALVRVAGIQADCAAMLRPFTRDGVAGGAHGAGPGGDFTHQHGFLVRGGILVRCDSAVMISAELYRDVVAQADELVLAASGGGGLHSCGRVGHGVPAMLELPSIRCFDFGQSELNPVDELYVQAREKQIPFLRVLAAPEELVSGSILRRFPTGVSLRCPVGSIDEARQVFQHYTSIRKKA